MTGINRPRLVSLIQSLKEKNLISVTNNGNRKPATICINKNYGEWEPVPKKDTSPQNGNRSVPQNDNRGVPNNGNHKRKKERKEISSDFLEFSRRFLEYQQAQLGEQLVKVTDKRIEDGAVTLEKLERLDGYSLKDDIRPVLHWAVKDEFWSSQIRSLASLRKNGSNGEMKFTNVFAAYKRSQPAHKVVEDVW
jgi:hypothetical protein